MSRGSQHVFSAVPRAEIPRSSFNRSHGHKTTINAGYLYPILVDEALPGDTFNVRTSIFARMATPIHPVMDNLYMDVFYFAVPNRLVWTNWQKMMGEQENPGDTIDYTVPQVTNGAGWAQGSLADYMGIPTQVPGTKTNALPFRAYNLIWNEWFRDQNLQPSVTVKKDNTDDPSTNYALLRRAKRHDYFTSCLPWPQKGEAVDIPLGTIAPVIARTTNTVPHWSGDGGVTSQPLQFLGAATANKSPTIPVSASDTNLAWGDDVGLVADLSDATAATINSLRWAFQVQKLLERDARGGTRYTEILRAHFGVVSPDARLQRPEFLGGGTIPINIHTVVQTSNNETDQAPLGELAAFGTAGSNKVGFVKSFTEHCYIIGLVMVRADLNYQQGLNRLWNRKTRYDFYWPVLSHVGEQAVRQGEIYFQGYNATEADGTYSDDKVFGYQERWAEYRYFPNIITGDFRSNASAPATLDSWHLAQDFDAPPTLSAGFIVEDPPVPRVLAVQDPNTASQFLVDCHFNMRCVRPMPVYSVPGYIDHF